MNNQIAFIDEFGNNGLDFSKEGVSTHFIVTAILIDRNNQAEIEAQVEKVRKSNFQTGEMKSSKIGNNDTRRLKIIQQLNEIPFYVFSVVIDKRELEGEGFNYKASFYKFLHALVDRELFRTFPDLLVVADEHGGQEFKTGFIKYMENRHIPDLFQQSEFHLSNSKSEILVQLADFICGSLSKCYDEKKMSPKRDEILTALKSKIAETRLWPINYKPYAYRPEKDFEDFNPAISELGINLAEQFITQFEDSTIPYEIDQCVALRYLLFYFKNISPENYVPTFEIKEQVEKLRGSEISLHYFRSRIIAKLRDKVILITSSSKGYKLPASTKNLYDFVYHSNSYIQPMIDRLLKCRNQIKLASKNELDIFDHEEFKYLNLIIKNGP